MDSLRHLCKKEKLVTKYTPLGPLLFLCCSVVLYAQARVGQLATDLDAKLEEIRRLAVSQAEYDFMKKAVEDLRKEVKEKDKASLDLKVSKCGCVQRRQQKTGLLCFHHGNFMNRWIGRVHVDDFISPATGP